MDMSRVKDGNYYVVQSFMVKDLKLKGLELSCYAIIYGFSQAEGQVFNGSLQYLSDWTCSSKQAVMTALKKLVEKNLLIKNDKFVNGVKFVEYSATNYTANKDNLSGGDNKVNGGMQESCIPPMKETLPNNISYKKENKTTNNIDLINKENNKSASAPNQYTKVLIDNYYIKEDEPFIDQYNYLFGELVNKHGQDLIIKCIRYFLQCWTGFDENGKVILNKFGYLKISIENSVSDLTRKKENPPVVDTLGKMREYLMADIDNAKDSDPF